MVVVRSSHQTAAGPTENEEKRQVVLTPNTPAAEPKAHLLHMPGNNSIPKRKSGRRRAACGLRKAPSCPDGRETQQEDCQHKKEDKGPKPTASQGKDRFHAATSNQPPYQGVPEDNTMANKGPPSGHCQRTNSQMQNGGATTVSPADGKEVAQEQQSSKPSWDDIPKSSSCRKTEKRTGGMLVVSHQYWFMAITVLVFKKTQELPQAGLMASRSGPGLELLRLASRREGQPLMETMQFKRRIMITSRDIKRDLGDLGHRVTTLEQTNDTREEEVDVYCCKLLELLDKNEELQYHLKDLDNRSRRSNIGIKGVPLQADSGKLEEYAIRLFQYVVLDLAKTLI
ncbi:hypothetical protein NDU88_002375 [Pleurodeles waltl]|uniref:Uncharacterized protein n=1 Tax=Pleurodeles waltl TaxID=8319 RepID=A0AAV7Q6F2_PLEWA|nr:hypothetical protein NDU88_002375 [Pleurodeles waltl]